MSAREYRPVTASRLVHVELVLQALNRHVDPRLCRMKVEVPGTEVHAIFLAELLPVVSAHRF